MKNKFLFTSFTNTMMLWLCHSLVRFVMLLSKAKMQNIN